jgi:cobalt-precorrin 5A hydrolase
MIAVGLGARGHADAQAIGDLVEDALRKAGIARTRVGCLASSQDRAAEPAFHAAAATLGFVLVLLPFDRLAARGADCATRSERVVSLFGVPSMAEAAALAAAGDGSHLVLPRLARNGITCAIAVSPDEKEYRA